MESKKSIKSGAGPLVCAGGLDGVAEVAERIGPDADLDGFDAINVAALVGPDDDLLPLGSLPPRYCRRFDSKSGSFR